jgi:hypothetical protein
MLIYKIARHIIIRGTRYWRLSCTFPEGNWYIDVVLTRRNHSKPAETQRFKLDPGAPTKVSLATS